ncbi:MAG: DNA-3-methyladenine glycosylase [Desulfuromonadales bacterium GWD2_61_12]|nr:MAG: DNA-3-methyladenine glycosylase [Desulfuromonadales bacterium GWC2_61_20]OGR33757.1 MAG: DNA-3-methyladenine glycosylase [Desulfuromonadales bacterium GWD2_61_12]HAD04978.1 DNA-3-methyladenine glycosylase I [Desulfuromonas sp.]HBT83005.1 DNA-3-methyladenine glycosylase I [Desulfuromonas sp.]
MTPAPAEDARRCPWCGSDRLYRRYHDEEWGVPVHDDRHLFEMLILEGAQAGLSWLTILRKRDNYRRAFDDFALEAVARYDSGKIVALLADPGIVRNRLKIAAAIGNARVVLRLREKYGSLDAFLWQFVDFSPRQNAWATPGTVPVRTPESDAMSAALKKAGGKFVGSTICYAFMQAVGMVNDHTRDCFRHREIADLTAKTSNQRQGNL